MGDTQLASTNYCPGLVYDPVSDNKKVDAGASAFSFLLFKYSSFLSSSFLLLPWTLVALSWGSGLCRWTLLAPSWGSGPLPLDASGPLTL